MSKETIFGEQLVCDVCGQTKGPLPENHVCKPRYKEIQDDNVAKEGEIKRLEEIETDLNNTIGFMERGISQWKETCDKLKDDIRYHKEMESAVGDLFKKDEARIVELETELEECQWVSVEDRLPEEFDRYYIVAAPAGMSFAETSVYHPLRKQFNRRLVSHWKPITLPESE